MIADRERDGSGARTGGLAEERGGAAEADGRRITAPPRLLRPESDTAATPGLVQADGDRVMAGQTILDVADRTAATDRLPGVARGGAFLIEPFGSREIFIPSKFTAE